MNLKIYMNDISFLIITSEQSMCSENNEPLIPKHSDHSFRMVGV